MGQSAKVGLIALSLVAASCTGSNAGTTTSSALQTEGTESVSATTEASTTTEPVVTSTTEAVGSVATSTTIAGPAVTTTTKPRPPSTSPPSQGSIPVTDGSTPVEGRPGNAEEVTVTSSELFVIGGDTLYLVVEGVKVGVCHRISHTAFVTGHRVDVEVFSIPDASFCTPGTDYKDSLPLGIYPPGHFEIFIDGIKVAEVDL